MAAILHAAELGVNWIDTAAVYGTGHSEQVVGEALRALPVSQRPLVFTKCGRKRGNSEGQLVTDLHPASIRKECEASLRRLGLETIDLYQLHWLDDRSVRLEDSWDAMVRLQEAGKVRAIGVCNADVQQLQQLESVRHVDSLQPPLSLIRRGAAEKVIAWAAEHETGVIVYSPMGSGLLTDRFSAQRMAELDVGDWRRQNSDFLPPALERNLELRDALRPIAARLGCEVGAVAVAWTLAWAGVTGAIVGARAPEQVDGWIHAAWLKLVASDLDEIAEAISSSGAGTGPRRPPLVVASSVPTDGG